MRNDMVQCKRCGETVKRKREAQVYCSRLCSDAAKKQRKRTQRSGDRPPPGFLRALRGRLENKQSTNPKNIGKAAHYRATSIPSNTTRMATPSSPRA